MRYFFIVYFITLSALVTAADYYVSSSGNNLNTGLSESVPWETIGKVNSVFSTFQPGDRILFKRGDTFYGTLVIKRSGISGSPITIGAYGSGSQPVITGFSTLSAWTNEGNGIFSASVNSAIQTNMVTVNGAQVAMGRYPDAGTNLTYTTSTATSIADPEISGTIDWTGAELVVNKNDWTLDRCKVIDHSGDVLIYSNLGSVQTPSVNRYYFIQNDLRCVTTTNEWFHNKSSDKFYIFDNPAAKTVKIATLNYLIDNGSYDYIIVDGLSFQGSVSNAINCAVGSDSWTIQNCNISFAGHSGINFAGGSNANIDNNTISNCNASGIYTLLNNSNITNNSVLQIGMIPGQSLLYHPIGIYLRGTDLLAQYNDIQHSGWSGIVSAIGTTFTIRNNFIDYSCQVLDDGGGIYVIGTANGLRTIEGNIVLNSGVGGSDNYITRGIYLDTSASNVLIKDNTTANCTESGIADHGGINNTYIGNISYNNSVGMWLQQYSTSEIISGTTIRNNILFAKQSNQFALRFIALTDNIKDFGSADNNYYARPVKDDDVILTLDPSSTGSIRRTLEDWQSFTNQDANSKKSPIVLTNTDDIRFEYNESKTTKVISLDQPMIDIKGTKYNNTITLLPYTSVLLMADPSYISPYIPVYVNSSIEYSTPSILEMTYNMTLANVVPDPSAFRVQVNSVNRTVNKVVIDRTKVLLTLSSPIVDGNVVTVSYTKPDMNPLQSASGDQASSIYPQLVTNKVNALRPALVSSSVENSDPDNLLMIFNLDISNNVPPASAFTVMINSAPEKVNAVSIYGSKVLLTLDSPVISGDIITVAYTEPSLNALRSTTGFYVFSFAGQPVTNNVDALRPVLVSSYIENNAPNILKMTYSLSLSNNLPDVTAFTVMVKSMPRAIKTVSISGTVVQLTLESPVVINDIITVSYTVPSANALCSAEGWYVLSFNAQNVTNKVEGFRPVLINSLIDSNTPNILSMTFSLDLSSSYIPPTSAFTVIVNSVQRTINSVTVAGSNVMLTLANSVVDGDVITVAYTIPSTNPLRSVPGWYVLSFGAQSVTNNVVTVRPTILNASMGSGTPSILRIAFNLNLSPSYIPPVSAFTVMVNSVQRSVSSVAISGTDVTLTLSNPVVYGDIVTVAYTISTNALRSVPGWYVLSFSAQPVTNNVLNVRPVLVSAAVEFTTPANLDMVFNLTLSSGYIPPVTAFTVLVNSVRRTVNSVSVSGAWVQLALASRVVYGDVITVAYTISSVALRSVPGWYVLSFNSQPVANKCLAPSSLASQKSSDTGTVNKISSDSEKGNSDFLSISTGRITLFPNPAIDNVNIYFPELSDKVHLLRIYDYAGRICLETRLDPDVNNLSIPLHLESGTYILKIVQGSRSVFTKKLVIIK